MVILLLAAVYAAGSGNWLSPVTGPVDDPNGEEPEDPKEAARREQEEWERRNEELKEELGPYYVPLPPLEQPANPPVKVRGLFITGNTVNFAPRFEYLLELIEETEINALVIDVKDDKGRMSYKSEIEMVNELDAYYRPVPIRDIRATLDDLHERGIYTIARIVVYRDREILPDQRPEWCIPLKGGGLYRDAGFAYGNPFIEELWDYNIAIAKEAALMGFREVQFDYIRFPDKAAYMDTVAYYPERNGRTKAEAIKGFVMRAEEALAPYNVYVSHDVFGVIANSWADHDDIGQIWEDFSAHCDYISPMVYPSHYGAGYFGFPYPDKNPAGTINRSLSDAIKRNAAMENPAIIRPWLQAFTASYLGTGRFIPYGANEVRQQIDAALELGIEEYILWNANNSYQPVAGGLLTAEAADRRAEEMRERRASKGQDMLSRTARDAAEAYLEAIRKKDWREALSLQRTGFTIDGDSYRAWLNATSGRLKEWEIGGAVPVGKTIILGLDVTVTLRGDEITLTDETWTLVLENGIWRISPSPAFLELLEGKESGEQG